MKDLQIQLKNFRSFKDTQPVKIAPITFLIGENSSGKTSFLSALHYLFEFQEKGNPKLNSDPFDIGSFKEIVHKESSSEFSFTIHETVDLNETRTLISFLIRQFSSKSKEIKDKKGKDLQRCSLTISFSSLYGSPEVCSIDLEVEKSHLRICLRPNVEIYLDLDDQRINFKPDEKVPSSLLNNSEKGLQVSSLLVIIQALISSFYNSDSKNKELVEARKIKEIPRAFIALSAFLNSFPENVIASAPIRSTPQRVYRAAQADDGPDGKGVPYRLRKIKVSDPKRWTKIRKQVNKFGREAGLFNDFNITKLTSDDAGPFQLKVLIDGRWASIADVGYGVSQTLPLIVDLLTKDRMSIYLYQQPEVHLHPMAQAGLGSFLAEHIGENKGTIAVLETHSDYLVDRVRMAIRNKMLSKDSVQILFFSSHNGVAKIDEIALDDEGQPIDPPDNYRKFFMHEEMKLLGIDF